MRAQDTLWASGYEVYDRISPKLRSFLETLSFTAAAPAVFKQSAEKGGWELHPGPRGAPENVGTSLTAAHPVVRTHPVTGYNSIFAIGPHVKKINELSDIESQQMLDFFLRIVTDNSELQVRHRWQNENDIGKRTFFFFPSLCRRGWLTVAQRSGTIDAYTMRQRSTMLERDVELASARLGLERSRALTLPGDHAPNVWWKPEY